jgi:hypothetical protein
MDYSTKKKGAAALCGNAFLAISPQLSNQAHHFHS